MGNMTGPCFHRPFILKLILGMGIPSEGRSGIVKSGKGYKGYEEADEIR